MTLADEILASKLEKNITEDGEVKIRTDRTIINQVQDSDPSRMSQGRLVLVFVN